jgi:hypothetical protein
MGTHATLPATLRECLAQTKDELAAAALAACPPAYVLENGARFRKALGRLRRQPFAAQFHVAAALAVALREHRGALLGGEPGAGTSATALTAAAILCARRVLVLAPAHLLGERGKWAREIRAAFGDVSIVEVRRVSDIDRLPTLPASRGRPLFVLLSRDRATLGAPWRHLAGEHDVGMDGSRMPAVDGAQRIRAVMRDAAGDPVVGFQCVRCGRPLVDLPTAAEARRSEPMRRWTRGPHRGGDRPHPQ